MATALMWLFIGSAVTLAIKEFQKLHRHAWRAKQVEKPKVTDDYGIDIPPCVSPAYRKGSQ